MSRADLDELEHVACPGPGACGGQYTANTMSMTMEVLGLSPLGYNSVPAADEAKPRVAHETGELIMAALGADRRPAASSPAARSATRRAAAVASGGSTNVVLHLLALACEAGVDFTISDFEAVARRTPLMCDLKPGGSFSASELHAAGGVPALVRVLLEGGYVDRHCPDDHRPDPGRGSRGSPPGTRPAGDQPGRRAADAGRQPVHPDRQPGSGRVGGEGVTEDAAIPPRSGPDLRLRGRRQRGGSQPAGQAAARPS